MKRIFLLTLALLLPSTGLRAASQATFTSVTGKVKIKDANGKSLGLAKMDLAVGEGDHIVAGPNAQATLKLFDGSQVQISPNTDLTLEKLQQPSLKDKIIQFKLAFGKLLATVQKLTSAKSSFEIDAGGVVCGVRGTEYSMFYDPGTGKVDVLVTDGTVWATGDGQTHEFHAGQGGTYLNGSWTFNVPPPGGNPPPTSDDHHPGFISSNPFYGFNGIGSDDFNNPLGNPSGGLDGVTDQVGNNGVAGLGAHVNLTLQLGFPQFLP